MSNRFRNLAGGGLALSLVVIHGTASPATSALSYDGLWSVVIVTKKGSCDRAYRYPIRISNGAITGKVAGNGAVTVTVSDGNKSATGSGRLSGTVGTGSWKGGDCAGTWEAERRSS